MVSRKRAGVSGGYESARTDDVGPGGSPEHSHEPQGDPSAPRREEAGRRGNRGLALAVRQEARANELWWTKREQGRVERLSARAQARANTHTGACVFARVCIYRRVRANKRTSTCRIPGCTSLGDDAADLLRSAALLPCTTLSHDLAPSSRRPQAVYTPSQP